MDTALTTLTRAAEENHINLRSSAQSSLPPPSSGKPATSLFGAFNTSQPPQNTTQAQTSSLFGTTSQPTQTSSLFGNTTTQPVQTSSLFGNTTNQPTQTSSLFGNTTSQPVQTSSLFGNTTLQPPQGGGMFGSNQNQVGNIQQQQQSSNLFGGNQSAQSGGGLFGSQQNNQQTAGGLFGSTIAQQPQPQPTNIFGSVGQNQTQQSQNSLFGGTGSQNKSSSLLFVPSHIRTPFGKALGSNMANDHIVAIYQALPRTRSLQSSHRQPVSCSRVRLVNTLNSSRPYQAFESLMSTSFAPLHALTIYMKTCRRSSNM